MSKFKDRLDEAKMLQSVYLGTKDAISEIALKTIDGKDWRVVVLREQLMEIERLERKLKQNEELIRSLKARISSFFDEDA